MNPDIWPLGVAPYYAEALHGGFVVAYVRWASEQSTSAGFIEDSAAVARGQVEAYEAAGETTEILLIHRVGLSGRLSWPAAVAPELFQPMELEVQKVGLANATARVALETGKTRTLDDPHFDIGWNPQTFRYSNFLQLWDEGHGKAEYIEIWLQTRIRE